MQKLLKIILVLFVFSSNAQAPWGPVKFPRLKYHIDFGSGSVLIDCEDAGTDGEIWLGSRKGNPFFFDSMGTEIHYGKLIIAPESRCLQIPVRYFKNIDSITQRNWDWINENTSTGLMDKTGSFVVDPFSEKKSTGILTLAPDGRNAYWVYNPAKKKTAIYFSRKDSITEYLYCYCYNYWGEKYIVAGKNCKTKRMRKTLFGKVKLYSRTPWIKGGKWGAFDANGKLIVPFRYRMNKVMRRLDRIEEKNK